MEICAQNLLAYAMRKQADINTNAIKMALTVSDEVCCVKSQNPDSIVVNGRVIDIFGNLSDKEIEKISKVGYDKLQDDVLEIITTSSDISDEELVHILLDRYGSVPRRLRKLAGTQVDGPTNPSGVPQKLHIIRPTDPPVEPPPVPNPPTPDDPVDPPEEDTDITLIRKHATDYTATFSMSAGETKVVCLQNPMDSKSYYYTITALNNSSDICLELLENGRFIIDADNLSVKAHSGQKDDIILIGNNNEIYTYDGNDIIRLGASVDMSGLNSNMNGSNTEETQWLSELIAKTENNVKNNTIHAGDGDDYIFYDYKGNVYREGNNTHLDGAGLSTVYGENGTDSYRSTNSAFDGAQEYNTLDNIELIQTSETQEKTIIASKINTFETFGQGALGDCRLISLFASLKMAGKTLSDLGITISATSSTYRVTFNNFRTAPKNSNEGSTYQVEFNKSELYTNNDHTVYAQGDLTVRVVEYAMNKLILENMSAYTAYDGNNVASPVDLSSTSYNDYARYLFGNSNFSWENTTLVGLDAAWAKYKNGVISNLCCGTDENSFSQKLQICNSHAYAITDVTSTYVEVINPWDSQDRLRIDREDFVQYFGMLVSYGNLELANRPSENWNGNVNSSGASGETNNSNGNIIDTFYYNQYVNSNEVFDEIASITLQMENVESVIAPKTLKKLELFS